MEERKMLHKYDEMLMGKGDAFAQGESRRRDMIGL